MFRVDAAAVELGRVPYWAKGIASFLHDRNALGGSAIPKKTLPRSDRILLPNVSSVTRLRTLFQKHRIAKVDFLQIDVEGYNYHVLKQFDFSRAAILKILT